ncbi:MAG: ligand-binding sensor domain-containing protein [Parvicellaceae bacterium]|jgi:ligand-binding sensor domain-containing protein
MVKILFSFALFLLCVGAYSQQYSFIPYSIEEGLPQTQVSSIIQDSKGNLWVGSVGGISKFNGIEFSNYSKADGLLDNQVNCLLLGEDDAVWMGCNGGVSIISGNSIVSHTLTGNLANASIRCLLIRDDYLYMGSRADGMFRCRLDELGDTISNVERIGDTSLTVREFCIYHDTILIGTDHGLKFQDADSLGIYRSLFNELDVRSATVNNGELWVSTIRQGFYKYSKNQITHFNNKYKALNKAVIRKVIIDRSGNPWVATRSGLHRWVEDHFVSYNASNGLFNDNIKVVYEDSEGNIWVGSDGAGILKFSGDRFVALTKNEGIASDLVMSFAEDSTGMWISTYGGGITYYQEDTIVNYTGSEQLSHQLIWCSEVDHNNQVWFGTSRGLTIKDESGVHPFPVSREIDNNRVTSLIEHDNKIFIGHRNGLAYYENDSLVNFNTDATIIRAMTKMPDGSLLIGSTNGLYEYRGGKLLKLKIEDDVDLYPVFCIEVMDENNYWIGNPNGLFRVRDKTAVKHKLGRSSGHNFINFLIRENDEILWAGTNHGVYEINISSFDSNDELILRNYTPADGTRSFETNLNAAYKSKSGVLWFGTINGAIMYKRSWFQQSQQIPNPVLGITEIQLSLDKTNWNAYAKEFRPNSSIPIGLSLPHSKNHLTFHFIGISHSYPKQVKYETFLDGFDEDWNPITQTRFITYSNLPPGSYDFKVRATIDESQWSQEQSFSFTIQSPFWSTWWFISILVLVAILILLLIYRARVKSEANKRKTESLIYKTRLMNLEQQSLNASMNRHFIFNALNSIQYYINRQDKLAANRYLSSFAKLIRKNLDSSSSPDNLVQLSEELERLDLYISLEHMRFQNKFEYEINIDPKIEIETIRVPAMFLQPYVENSIWHGVLPLKQPGKIEVIVAQDESNITFVIQDNGIGIDTSLAKKSLLGSSHESKGMKITSSRINILRKITKRNIQIIGPFEVKNEANEGIGTKVEIIFPRV